ncbi:ArdC family protein [Pontibacter akesuensis]|uniref:Antirestriction protein ArdC n=1 Tax=Pontibacter akesuensis TaxID=388950 RepID=A0A1I7KNW3_9BACT|nr:ArdC-like ssDNA-binding domain-containing protein [Pontibacter akesuensis]GHA81843.1 DNA primase [Pontibacter akesuensis]SFU99133.1 Antirestriction protein ArdC [Pontibacter akesuensis]
MNSYQKLDQLAQQVTSEIMAQLEQGKVPWQKPWTSYGLPKNYLSGRHYEGFNAFYLHYITEERNFTTPYFLTFKQAQELGGHVRKGEKGTPVIYWKTSKGKAGKSAAGQEEEEKEGHAKTFVPFIWTVFNLDQVEGVDFALPAPLERTEVQLLAACQRVVEHFPLPQPRIAHGGLQAYYAPETDRVQLPERKRFNSSQAYHATLFHELIHATGHPARLNRFRDQGKAGRFGDENYGKEELIAEMGASFLCAFTGIKEEVFHNSVAYLQGWMRVFKADRTMLVYASARAFKAATFILGLQAAENREGLPAVAA